MRFWTISFATAIRKGATTDRAHERKLSVGFSAGDNSIIAKNDVARSASGFVALGHDPWFLLKPKHCLRRGWYRLDLKAFLPDGYQPRVYFNFGHGFQERFGCPLYVDGDRYSAIVRAYKPTLSVRLDPVDRAVDFDLKSFTITPANPILLAKLRLLQMLGIVWNLAKAPLGWRMHFADLRRDYLSTRGFVTLPVRYQARSSQDAYLRWIRARDYSPERGRAKLEAEIQKLAAPPLISVLMPVYNPEIDHLNKAIDSVSRQIYPNWELCIADDGSTDPAIRRTILSWVQRDRRIKVIFRGKNGHISEATNSAFALAKGEWVALLDHDDLLREHALAEVALTLSRDPTIELVYSDEDKIDSRGRRADPHFKPDFSIDLLRSMNYLNHLTVHRSENIRMVGGWRRGFEGSQDYDLNLRIIERIPASSISHIPKILYHWRTSAGSTASDTSEKSYAYQNGLKALAEHIERCQLPAQAEPLESTPYFRIRYHVPEPAPLVSLIIPTRDGVHLLETSIGSVLQKTTYKNYEIIVVDNGSSKPETHRFFKNISSDHANIRIIRYDREFNYSAINNFAVQHARGTVLGLLNNDIEVISPDWLTAMVARAVMPEVGCVGAKLYYPDGTIQHGGVILGLGSVAGHAHKHFPRNAAGYFARLLLQQNLSAVTAACLVVRKDVYLEVGGLEEQNLPVAFNDVDFCLRVREAGYLNVFTPFAELYHHESVSRGNDSSPEKMERSIREIAFMRARWGRRLDADPYYSPNLTLQREDFSYAE